MTIKTLFLGFCFVAFAMTGVFADETLCATNTEWKREWMNKKGKKVIATWIATDEYQDAIYLIDNSGREFWMARDNLCKEDRLFVQKKISTMYQQGFVIRNRRFVPIKLWSHEELSRQILDLDIKLTKVLSLLGDVKCDVGSAKRAAESADRSSRNTEFTTERLKFKLRDFD